MSKTLQSRHATASGPPDSAALVLINMTTGKLDRTPARTMGVGSAGAASLRRRQETFSGLLSTAQVVSPSDFC